MNRIRRKLLRLAGAVAAAAWTGVARAGEALGAAWNRSAFEAKAVAEVLKNLGAGSPAASRDIVITAPDIAEDGAAVPITVTSRIPDTQSISIIAEKNPFPLTATHDITSGGEAYISIRLKMAESSNLRVVVRAGGRYYTASKEVKITIGGCAV